MSDYEMEVALKLDDANRKLDLLAGKFDNASKAGKKLADSNAKQSKEMGKSLDGLVSKVGALGAAYLTTAGAVKAWSVASSSAKARDSIKILEAAGGSIADLRKQTKGFVDDATLAKNANLARIMGINQDEFARLANMARAAAKLTGESTEFMLESVVKGTARGSKLLLDNLGILVDVKKANKDYAKQLKINVRQMTDEQKKRAFKIAVLKEEKKMVDQVKKAGADQADAFERAEVAAKNMGKTIGDLLGPALRTAARYMEHLTKWTDKFFSLQPESPVAQKRTQLASLKAQRQTMAEEVFGMALEDRGSDLNKARKFLEDPKLQQYYKDKGVLKGARARLKRIAEIDATIAALSKELANPKTSGPGKGSTGYSGDGLPAAFDTNFAAPGDTLGGRLDPFLANQLAGEQIYADIDKTRPGAYLKSGDRMKASRDPFLQAALAREKEIRDAKAASRKAEKEAARAQADLERRLHDEKMDRIAEYQNASATALNLGVDLTMSAFQMIADQEEHILLKLAQMGLARTGNILIGEGVLAASKGAAYAIESFGADPRGVALMAQGGAMIAGGVAMGGAAIGIGAHVANMEGAGASDSVGASATRVRTTGAGISQGAGDGGGINLTVVYNGAGPGADEQAKVAASLINRARQMGLTV